MKNLANCKPSEFLAQTNKIRKSVAKWLSDTDIANIRKVQPELRSVPISASVEERADIIRENAERVKEQAKKNLNLILEQVMEKHPDETLELLALLCFVEPKDVDKHPVSEYLTSLTELINDKAVIGFFTSLAQLEKMDTSA